MSSITSVVLITSLREDKFVGQVNEWIVSKGAGPLCKLPGDDAGGNKWLTVDVYAAAYNYMPFCAADLIGILHTLQPLLLDSGGDCSVTICTEDGTHTQWACDVW